MRNRTNQQTLAKPTRLDLRRYYSGQGWRSGKYTRPGWVQLFHFSIRAMPVRLYDLFTPSLPFYCLLKRCTILELQVW